MFIQISHNRIGPILWAPLDKSDFPITSLNLHTVQQARAFHGTIRSSEYLSEDGPLFLFDYALQPAVVLRKQDDAPGLKLLIMLAGTLNFQPGSNTDKFSLATGQLCLFRSTDYTIDLPESSQLRYLLFDIDPLVDRFGLVNLAEGRYNRTPAMLVHLTEILYPPKLLANPAKWLSMRLLNLLHQLDEEMVLNKQRTGSKKNHLDFALAADAFIQRNFDRNFTTIEISKQVGLNECDLKSAFSNFFGMGMAKRQTLLRMELATHLLKHSDMSILDVALACGYSSYKSLCSNFKMNMHQKPAIWRKNNKS